MSELPKHWTEAELGELVPSGAPILYGILQPGPDLEGGVPYVRPTEITEDVIQLEDLRRTSESISKKYRRSTLEGDDIILSMVGTIGKVAIVPPILEGGNITQSAVRIRPNKKVVDPRYLAWLLRSPGLRQQYDASRLGTAVPRLNVRDIRTLKAPLAPLPEQRRIVARIEELFSRLDAGVIAFSHAKAQLKRYRQSVLAAAVTGQLTRAWRAQHPDTEPAGELLLRILKRRREQWTGKGKYKEPEAPVTDQMPQVPENWVWARLDSLCAIGSGMSVSKNRKLKVPVEVPYLRVANVQRGRLILDEIKTMMVEKERLDEMCLKNGDILFNEGGDRDKLGRGWIWEGQINPCITQNHVFRATPFDPKSTAPKLLSHWGNSFGQQFFIDEGTQTTNLASINKGVLSSFPVPIPPVAEQRQILAQLEARTAAIDHLSADIGRQLKRATRLKQAILKTAFSGDLVNQDRNDPSAKNFLDEIAAAKLKAAQEPKKPAPKKERKMPHKSLIQIISANPKGITPEALLGESKYNEESIEDFYRDLALIRNQIEEIKPKGNASLEWPYRSKILIKPKAMKK